MKAKLSLVLALVVALSAAVVAQAKPPAPQAGAACKPTVSFILKGTLASVDAAGNSFTMNVTAANKHGRQFKGQNGLAVSVDAKTKFRRNGRAQLSDLLAGDRLVVQVRACKTAFAPQQPSADPNAPAPAAPTLLAKRVVAHPAQTSSDSGDSDSSSGSPTSP